MAQSRMGLPPIRALVASALCCLLIEGCSVATLINSGSQPSSKAQPISVSVYPGNATIGPAQSQQFYATVVGSSNVSVNWEVNGVIGGTIGAGTITQTGVYVAPSAMPQSGSITVEAISTADQSVSAAAAVTVIETIAISPVSATVAVGGTLQFWAMVNGSISSNVRWNVNGIEGGNAAAGTITSAGAYAAPAAVPAGGVTVSAVDPNDNQISASSAVTIFDPAVAEAHNQWLDGVAEVASTYRCTSIGAQQEEGESVDSAISRFGESADEGSCLVLFPVSTNPALLIYSVAWGGAINGKDITYISDISQIRIWNAAAVTGVASGNSENAAMVGARIERGGLTK